ncbi:hypothetical protein Ahy_B09g099158 [Arachis hypogaea]|uniref:Uncharacterized protein n=1 Tax=Arachis hypogaea TaxID=3818 RepID=A0A444XT20_ARAHY|nr:hypothetical protein Ahy_B09g099158 [Arachis hypogaea]
MEGDIIMVIKVNISVVISLCYCYWIAPIICFFLFIPFNFSSVHLRGNTGFFFAWLGTFKLILFAFNKGSLFSDPSTSLGRFVASASLPIKIQQNQPHIRSKTSQDGKSPPPPNPSKYSKNSHFVTNPSSETPKANNQSKEKTSPTNPSKSHTPLLPYAIKAILLASLVKLYDYSDQIHPKVIFGMYCFHIYFMLELLLATFAALARTMGMKGLWSEKCVRRERKKGCDESAMEEEEEEVWDDGHESGGCIRCCFGH